MCDSLFKQLTGRDNIYSSNLFCIFLIFILALFVPGYGYSQTFAEGKAAYQIKDYEKALEIFRPLAEQGDSDAQATLGIMYEFGRGVPIDKKVAMEWYIKAAMQGNPNVQHDIGVKLFQGQGMKQDYEQAAYWWEQSASAGIADSQFNLALMYYRGLGIEQDYKQASKLFLAAAKQGHANAQYSLGVMHAFGQGMEKDNFQALTWFRKSAAQGAAQAQFNLGVLYENGQGLEKNLKLAREWYQRAADQGLEEARKKLAMLDIEQTAETITHPDVESISATSANDQVAKVDPRDKTTSQSDIKAASSVKATTGIKRENWIMQQHPKTYTLQLGSVIWEKDIIEFITENNLGNNAAYIEVVINGVTRFTALYGVFSTYAEAQEAIKELPVHIQKGKPWVRNFGILQGLLKQG